MKSMTGYAYTETYLDDTFVSVEIKSLNSRFLDLSVNLPYWLSKIEKKIRDYFSTKILRGKVDVTLRIREAEGNISVYADTAVAKAYTSAIKQIADSIGFSGDIPFSSVISQEGVLRTEHASNQEQYFESILPVLDKAFGDFEKSRIEEGRVLKDDVLEMVSRIRNSMSVIEKWIPSMEENFRRNIRAKFEDVLGKLSEADEQRIMQETAALLVKYTINEEVVRLHSHLNCLCKEIEENPAPGKKLDFICQEINREANTIGSKNQDLESGMAVISIKDALENIREQIRNIE